MAITLFGTGTASPTDNGTQAGPGPLTAASPASMTANDVPLVFLQMRTTDSQLTFQNTSARGQSWQPYAQAGATNMGLMVQACRFNGTWTGGDPTFENTNAATTAMTAVMAVVRPTSTSKIIDTDVSPKAGTFAAGSTPFTKTITGITTLHDGAIVFAVWASTDDNTWDSLTGGWTAVGQFRNLSGSDMSMYIAYKVMTTAGSTGNVSANQATLGGDAGATLIFSLYERDAEFASPPAVNVYWDAETSTNGTTMTAAIMDSGTHLSSAGGSWSLVGGTPNLSVSTSGEQAFGGSRKVTVSSTDYSDTSGTRGMAQDHNAQGAAAHYFAWTKTTAVDHMSMGVWFKPGMAYQSFNSFTQLGIQDGGFAGGCFLSVQAFDTGFHRTYIENVASELIEGPRISKDTWYWVTIEYDKTNNLGRIAFYDTSFNQVGFTLVERLGSGTPGQANQLFLGSFGGGFPSEVATTYYDDMVGDWSGAFPLGPAATAGVSITPGLGQLTLTGLAPTVSAAGDVSVSSGLGQLTLAGLAPTASATDNKTASPGLGALSLTAAAPSLAVTENQFAAPDLGTLTLSGLAPSLAATDHHFVDAGLGELTFTGLDPSVSSSNSPTISTGLGQLTITGYEPSQTLTLATPAAALVFTGLAPAIAATEHQFSSPGLGTLTLAGAAPAISATENQFAAPSVAGLTVTGFAPSVSQAGSFQILPGVGILEFLGLSPSVQNSGDRRVGAGSSKKRRRKYTVEVDGQTFAVSSPEEAEAVLATAREVAQEKVSEVLNRAAKAQKRPLRKVLADARKALRSPQITTDAPIDDALQQTLRSIENLYRSTLQTVEIGALMRPDDDGDEELILMLL